MHAVNPPIMSTSARKRSCFSYKDSALHRRSTQGQIKQILTTHNVHRNSFTVKGKYNPPLMKGWRQVLLTQAKKKKKLAIT